MIIANFHSSLKHKFSSNIFSEISIEKEIVSKILDTWDILAHFTLSNLPSLISLVLSSPFLIRFTRISLSKVKKEFGGMATYLSALGTSFLDMI